MTFPKHRLAASVAVINGQEPIFLVKTGKDAGHSQEVMRLY
jgi:hypothetical protein